MVTTSPAAPPAAAAAAGTHIDVRKLTVNYGDRIALNDVSMSIPRRRIFAIIGPAN